MSKKGKKVELSPEQAEFDRVALEVATALGSDEMIAKLAYLFQIDSDTKITSDRGVIFTKGVFERGYMGSTLEETGAHFVAKQTVVNEVRGVMSTLSQALKPQSVEEVVDNKKSKIGKYE